jgi:RNA polymerase sigma factor (sigma-70 family)
MCEIEKHCMDEREFVEQLRRGDDAAFRQVVEQYQKLVLNCAYRFVRNKEAAEDLTQEVFLEVYESIRSFRGDARLSTWIYRIAVTKSLNHIKRQSRKKRFAMITTLFGEAEHVERLSMPDATGPEGTLENRERVKALNQALDRLPENQRIAFTLSKVEDLSYEEISRVMNVSISAVESLLYRAKGNLRKLLYEYYRTSLS